VSNTATGGRLAYAFTAVMVLGFQPVAGPGSRSFNTWFPVKGRYLTGADSFDWQIADHKHTDNRLAFFAGQMGTDGTKVVGVIPTCGSSTFDLRALKGTGAGTGAGAGAHGPSPINKDIILPVGCFEIGCLKYCEQVEGSLLSLECLEELWAMAGCDKDGLFAPRRANKKQVEWWKAQPAKVTLSDMQFYKRYAAQQNQDYRNMCYDESKPEHAIPVRSASIRSSLSTRLQKERPYHELLSLTYTAGLGNIKTARLPLKEEAVAISTDVGDLRQRIGVANEDVISVLIAESDAETVYAGRETGGTMDEPQADFLADVAEQAQAYLEA